MKRRAADNVIVIPSTINDIFTYWFEFLRPLHRLSGREIQVMAALVRERFNLSKKISDPEILEKVVLGEDVRKKIRQELNISIAHYQVIIGKIKKIGLIADNKINPKFIPRIEYDDSFRLMILFNFPKDEGNI